MSRRSFADLAWGCLLLALTGPAEAGVIGLSWDASPESNGYRVHYGTESGNYTTTIAVGNVTSHTITGLPDCTDLHFAVTAYNAGGESDFSDPATSWSRPEIGSSSIRRMQGTQAPMTVRGLNFQSGATITTDNPHIFLDSPAVVACDEIQLLATVEPMGGNVRPSEVGVFNLTVENPNGVQGGGAQTLEVMVNPVRFDVNQTEASTLQRIDGLDLSWLSRRFGSEEGGPLYSPDLDLDGDGWVDGVDLALMTGVSAWGGCRTTTPVDPQGVLEIHEVWSAAACGDN